MPIHVRVDYDPVALAALYPQQETAPRPRSPYDLFVEELVDISPGNLRAIWLPRDGDHLTNITPLPGSRLWTYNATAQGRVAAQGNGVLISFTSTSSHKVTTPDTDDLSFVEPSPFSLVVLANVTSTLGHRGIASKGSADEWQCRIDSSGRFILELRDVSAAVSCSRYINTAVPTGTTHQYGFSYDGGGGATAANGITLYQDAVAPATTVTNNAAYVAMENATAAPAIGAQSTIRYFDGSMGLVAVWAANLSAAQHLAVKVATNRYFGTAL